MYVENFGSRLMMRKVLICLSSCRARTESRSRVRGRPRIRRVLGIHIRPAASDGRPA